MLPNLVLEKGNASLSKHSDEIENRFSQVGKEDLATLIYTSGTTCIYFLNQSKLHHGFRDALEIMKNFNDPFLIMHLH